MIKQCSNNCHYDNTPNTHAGKDIVMTRFLPSTGYSLLHPDSTNGETLMDRKDGYCALDRSQGRVRPKKKQRDVQDGYSKLSYKTV